MNYKDLKELLDKIEKDSMCRDEIFYDRGEGMRKRRRLFFKYLKELKVYFDWYLESEDDIMKIENQNEDTMWEIMKTQNSYSRQEEVK